MVKKLRYYARFIVVSLLLNKVDLVKELIRELHHYVEEYVTVYEAEDDEEWRLVISEVTAFMEVRGLNREIHEFVFPKRAANLIMHADQNEYQFKC